MSASLISMFQQTNLYTHEQAMATAWKVINSIQGWFDRIEICGSLRRGAPLCHDIDLVCMPHNTFMLGASLGKVCQETDPTPEKIKFMCDGIPGEIYLVNNLQQFEVMKLERTGDFMFTKTLASEAIKKGLVFRFSVDKGYYRIPMYGLYKLGGSYKDKHEVKHYYCNDMIHPVAAIEDEIIYKVFGRHYSPEERSWYEGRDRGESATN